jgi:predicted Ser/Thr protein kinase
MLPSGVILAQKTQKAAFPHKTAGKAASFFHAAVEQAFRLDSVGINRREVV